MKHEDLLELVLEKLRWLRLPGMVEALPGLLEQAKRENATLLALVGKLADAEKSSRIKSAVTRRIRDARFPEVNTVDGFDFDFDPVRRKLKLATSHYMTWRFSTRASIHSSSAILAPARHSLPEPRVQGLH